jgi:two-component system, LytTR family, sensor histidine kinase AlgZ
MLALSLTGKQDSMQKKSSNSLSERQNSCYLPDYCKGENILRLILVLELIAIVFALSSYTISERLFVDIALISILIQWIGLGSAGVLCMIRRVNRDFGNTLITIMSLLAVSVITLVMSLIAYRLNSGFQFGLFGGSSEWVVLSRHVTIAVVLQGLALRYFYMQYHSQKMLKTESRARLQALQARIRPHFLFNSLNTIASLTYDQPERAERAIEGLSELFRASLKADSSITLQQEIDFTQEYIDLESLRLDDRLQVSWIIDAEVETIQLPALTLQPLVENAIYHGIEPLPGGGEVRIEIHQTKDLVIQISNPLNPRHQQQHAKGNKMALNNIRERLALAFHGQAKIEHLVENDLYKVVITIPLKITI